MSDNMESAKASQRSKHEHLREREANAAGWLESIEEMLEATQANDVLEQDNARQTIEESVLEVCVRDGWRVPGQTIEDGPEEYYVLLTTGGPALRIYGRLNEYGSPKSAELQMQDWGTPWTRYPAPLSTRSASAGESESPEAKLLAFAQHFYFGE